MKKALERKFVGGITIALGLGICALLVIFTTAAFKVIFSGEGGRFAWVKPLIFTFFFVPGPFIVWAGVRILNKK